MNEDTATSPSPAADGGASGRDPGGRFTPGNAFGRGNPHSRRVGQLRSAMLRAISASDIFDVIQALVRRAKQGNVAAAKVLLDRLFGREVPADLAEQLQEAHSYLAARVSSNGQTSGQ